MYIILTSFVISCTFNRFYQSFILLLFTFYFSANLRVASWKVEILLIYIICLSFCSWLKCAPLCRLPLRFLFRNNYIWGEFPALQYVNKQIQISKCCLQISGLQTSVRNICWIRMRGPLEGGFEQEKILLAQTFN